MSLLKVLGLPPSQKSARTAAAAKPLTIITSSGATQILAGASERLRVTVHLNGGAKDVTGAVTWQASADGVSVSSMGTLHVNGAAGKVILTATHPATGATGSLTITVVARILQKITISPTNPLFEPDCFEPLHAQGEFSDGSVEDVTSKVVWESRHEKVARMESDGHCHTLAPGKADIWASDPDAGVIDTTRVTVAAAGKVPKLVRLNVTPVDPKVTSFAPLQFAATGDFADKSSHEATGRVRWVSDKPDVIAIDPSTGVATAGLVTGTAWITAVDDATAVWARSQVTVDVPTLTSIEINPRDPSMKKGQTLPVSVKGTFSNLTTEDVTDKVVWASDNRAVAAVDPVLKEIFGSQDGPPVGISASIPNFPDVGDFISVTVEPL